MGLFSLSLAQVHVNHGWVQLASQRRSSLFDSLHVDAVAQLFVLLAQKVKLGLIFIFLLIVVLIVENVTHERSRHSFIAKRSLRLVSAGPRVFPLVRHEVADFLETDASRPC